ncbi:MAG: RNA polymerase sigma factor [Fibrobacter sp.]|nr:RNA polymerase sigma factor [Fibrobacter sp.]
MDEKQAIALCLINHDPAGFAFLFKKYRKEAFFHATGFLGNRSEAADACQDSFSRAFIAITKLKQLDEFYPWFYTILRNCCLNIISRKKTRTIFEPEIISLTEKFASIPSPEEDLYSIERKKLITEALSRLKAEFREILLLKYVHELNYDRIGVLLSIPKGTVMSRLYHARRSFCDEYLRISKESGGRL